MKKIVQSVWANIKFNIFEYLAFLFGTILPIIAIGCVVSLSKNESGFKWTVWGYLVIALLVLAIFHFIKKKVYASKPSIYRGIVLVTYKLALWGIVLAGLILLSHSIEAVISYWYTVGVLFAIACVFIILDNIYKKRLEDNRVAEINELNNKSEV